MADLVIIETHPVQYHAPVYRCLAQKFGVALTVIYGSDFSVKGYYDREFQKDFSWDTDLLSGYASIFLASEDSAEMNSYEEVSSKGLCEVLHKKLPSAALVVGYAHRLYLRAFWECWRMKIPVMIRAEVTDHARARNRVWSYSRDLMLRFLYSRCSALLYIGKRSYMHYKRLGCPDERLFFSPYCVSEDHFVTDQDSGLKLRKEKRKELQIPHDQFAILFSGKLSRRKAPDMMVKAVKRLPPEIKARITLVFLGDGELSKELRALALTIPEVKTIFLGFQNQTQLSPCYHAADLLVLPSLHSETWGLVVNEALSHGVPALVSNAVGCAPDLIEPGVTGDVFDTGSEESLSAALIRSLKFLGSADVRHKCREKAKGYTVEKAAEGMAQAYHFCCRQRTGQI